MQQEEKLYPGGLGPWFVAMLINVSNSNKKQTHILAHTYPHLAVDILNKGTYKIGGDDEDKNKQDTKKRSGVSSSSSSKDNFWILLIKVGPFTNWANCISYLNLWSYKTRGRSKRIEKGIELYLQYCNKLSLTLWVQTHTKNYFETNRSCLNQRVVSKESNRGEQEDSNEESENNTLTTLFDVESFGNEGKCEIRTIKRQKTFA